jgi:ubiquinone/menaquinone biosynthesis C-methylase UbiE
MTEIPPVCDYEGSDYQSSFWDRGERAYEDAVEGVALKRLLPQRGKLLLELGAGAGRNTPRYSGYERVVLVDYSHTQLEQAQQRLGAAERYLFIAADIYRLPFQNGIFDGATMIRTLHHMAEPRLALEQVRNVLQENAVFILEYANKHNLKAIFRYLFHKQQWNPFSPEPIEFAALNFDFHPATVRSWLQNSQFALERQLTVSHYRMAFFKKFFPLKLLVFMDSLAQLSGDAWQLSPSVFVRNRAVGSRAQGQAGLFFKCPACGNGLTNSPSEIICEGCGRHYAVENGIYDFRIDR